LIIYEKLFVSSTGKIVGFLEREPATAVLQAPAWCRLLKEKSCWVFLVMYYLMLPTLLFPILWLWRIWDVRWAAVKSP